MQELMDRGEKMYIDSKPTIIFNRKIDSLVETMNSNTENIWSAKASKFT
jgi:hypothetical protein